MTTLMPQPMARRRLRHTAGRARRVHQASDPPLDHLDVARHDHRHIAGDGSRHQQHPSQAAGGAAAGIRSDESVPDRAGHRIAHHRSARHLDDHRRVRQRDHPLLPGRHTPTTVVARGQSARDRRRLPGCGRDSGLCLLLHRSGHPLGQCADRLARGSRRPACASHVGGLSGTLGYVRSGSRRHHPPHGRRHHHLRRESSSSSPSSSNR